MFDPSSYNIVVRRADFDGEYLYEATVKEIPDVAEYGETFEEAYELALDTIAITAKYFSEKGRAMPLPFDKKVEDYSGRVTLRLPKSLHKAVSDIAEREEISLNQLLVSIVAGFNGFNSSIQESAYQTLSSISVAKKSTKKRHLKLVSNNSSGLEACNGF